MRAILLVLLALTSGPTNARQPVGSFTCAYVGSWSCASPDQPQGICIDSGRPQPKRFTLLLNFDSKPFPRFRLNGLDGHLEPGADALAYAVAWSLPVLGHPKFSTSWGEDGGLKATFIHTEQSGAYVSANFKCHRAPKSVL
jgi:hypothetical protein